MAGRNKTPAYAIALGGLLAALAVVVMSVGTLIPVATYVCPVLCMVLLQVVLSICGRRIAWTWYAATALLSALLAQDKEAAAVFAFLGYYPILKPGLDKNRMSWFWKAVFFNVSVLVLYWLLIGLLGMDALTEELGQVGGIAAVGMLLLGNVTFFLLDRLLSRRFPGK